MQIERIVFIFEEAGSAVVTALNDMDRDAGKCEASSTGHGTSPMLAARDINPIK